MLKVYEGYGSALDASSLEIRIEPRSQEVIKALTQDLKKLEDEEYRASVEPTRRAFIHFIYSHLLLLIL